MNIIFAGTPEFAVPVLQALHESNHTVMAVYTQPDRPAGRGRQLSATPVKQYALAHNLVVEQPAHFSDQVTLDRLEQYHADAMVVVGYGLLLPITVLRTPAYGCINIHPSLLPKWRGPTPVQYALLHGDSVTGVSIMQLDKGMDAGPIYLQEQYTIKADETAGQLYDTLFTWGAELLLGVLDLIEAKRIEAVAQDDSQASYTHKIEKADARIDWQQPAVEIARRVRAYNPWPVAYCDFHGSPLRIWQAEVVDEPSDQPPGTFFRVAKHTCHVATGVGQLRLLQVQAAGKRIQSAQDFINSSHF